MRPTRRSMPPIVAAVGLLLASLAFRSAAPGAEAQPLPPVHEVRLSLAVPDGEAFAYVEISMFALDDGTAPLADRVAEGRAAMLARFPGAIELEPADVTAQFHLFGIRWREPFATWLYNPANGPASMPAETAFAAIKAGAEGWTGAGGTGWRFDFLATTDTPTGCNGIPESIPQDGLNVVGWGHIAGGYLGYSCWWRSSTLVEGTPYFEMTEFDIIFEPLFPYTSGSLRALALHEFGHAIGLGHTETSLCPGQAMCEGLHALIFDAPQEDDLFGLVALYGLAPTPTPTRPPTSTPFPTATPAPRPARAVVPGVARD